MSEYQYYEFLAIDRPLTAKQIDQVRQFSTRAEISATSFVNEYHWGDFRGEPEHFLEHFFDVMLYYANWGTHQLMMGLPADAIPHEVLELYCVGDSASFKRRKNRILLDLILNSEEGGWDDDLGGSMAELAPVREELLRGDYRALFLGWLLSVRQDDLDDDEPVPPVPPGLSQLSAPQTALVVFLKIDQDLLAVARAQSGPLKQGSEDLTPIIARLASKEKDDLLEEFLRGDDPHLALRMRRKLLPRSQDLTAATGQTVGDLRAQAQQLCEEREEQERRAAAERAERKRLEAQKKRREQLDALARRGDDAWREAQSMIERKTSKAYDEAASLLADLREIAVDAGALDSFARKMSALQGRYANRPALVQRLRKKNLI